MYSCNMWSNFQFFRLQETVLGAKLFLLNEKKKAKVVILLLRFQLMYSLIARLDTMG